MSEPQHYGGRDQYGNDPVYIFELYMIGTSPSSSRAVVNVRKICEEHLKDQYDLKVIDVSIDREAASREQILAAPTLIVRSPQPERRYIGDLSDPGRFISGLNLKLA